MIDEHRGTGPLEPIESAHRKKKSVLWIVDARPRTWRPLDLERLYQRVMPFEYCPDLRGDFTELRERRRRHDDERRQARRECVLFSEALRIRELNVSKVHASLRNGSPGRERRFDP